MHQEHPYHVPDPASYVGYVILSSQASCEVLLFQFAEDEFEFPGRELSDPLPPGFQGW